MGFNRSILKGEGRGLILDVKSALHCFKTHVSDSLTGLRIVRRISYSPKV